MNNLARPVDKETTCRTLVLQSGDPPTVILIVLEVLVKIAFVLALLFCSQSGSTQDTLITAPDPVSPVGVRPFSAVGIDANVGIGGIGFDLATLVTRKFNLRAGAEFFDYSTTFQEQGATVAAHLRMQSAHAALDWFPFRGGFRLSPLVVFANNNRGQATALIPAGETVSLNGENYASSASDPLHGAGSVDFRKVSPGLSFGFGNMVPHSGRHFTFPLEAGFYYVGQPGLKVTFTGSACDPTQPPAIGCAPVDQDSGFQQNLAQFIARNNHNLSYASYFPIFSFGFGYAFHPGR